MEAFQLRRLIEQAVLESRRVGKEPFVEIKGGEIRAFPLNAGYETPEVHLRFERVTFKGDVLLEQIQFRSGISFIDCDFRGRLSFNSSHFHGPAYFWKCRFYGPAHFSHIVVLKKNFRGGRLCDGEANFSYCEFRQDATFRHAVFYGPAYFHRTVFGAGVDFEVARFESGASFSSRLQDVCVSEHELPEGTAVLLSAPLANAETNVLTICEDRTSGYFNFDQRITSREMLEERLTAATSNPRISRHQKHVLPFVSLGLSRNSPGLLVKDVDVKAICDVWERYADSYMFSSKHSPNFMEAFFGPNTWFRYLSMRRCQLRRADLSKVRFEDVHWAKERGFSVRRRAKVYDDVALRLRFGELNVKDFWRWSKDQQWRSRDCRAVSSLYHQLRVVAEAAGERSLARDFYFGEMETSRLAEPPLRRAPLAYIYKFLSGYGTQENRAAVILFVLLLVIFPAFYCALNHRLPSSQKQTRKSQLLTAETVSLEAATFLLRPNLSPRSQNADDRERLTESVERLMISIQATLFVLSLKSKFQRGQEST